MPRKPGDEFMVWHAESNFKQIAKGTVLTLMFTPMS